MTDFQPAAYYLPHESPMVLLETVCAVEEEFAVCEVVVSPNGILAPFLNPQGELPAWFAIEMMAQTIGVWNGWHGQQRNEESHMGLLLGSRGFKTTLPRYPDGSRLRITATMLLRDHKLANFECQLEINGQTVTQAKLNVYQPDLQEIQDLIQKPKTEDSIA